MIFGCGYLGQAVARAGLADGREVWGLTRNPAVAEELRRQGVTVIEANLARTDWHDRLDGTGADVLNCVGSGGNGLAGYRESYLAGMESLLQWLNRQPNPGTIVYTSSTSVYVQGGGQTIDESGEIWDLGGSAGGERGARGRVLVSAERLLMENARCRWFVLRLAGLYGPGRHHLVAQVRSGAVTGKPEHHLNLVHRDDAASAIRACFDAASSERDRVFNVTDGAPSTRREVVEWLAQQLRVQAPPFLESAAAGRAGATPDRIILSDRLRRSLGWQPAYPDFRFGYQSILAEGLVPGASA